MDEVVMVEATEEGTRAPDAYARERVVLGPSPPMEKWRQICAASEMDVQHADWPPALCKVRDEDRK